MGPVHKRHERSAIVTKEINRPLKRSLPYFETMRSKLALDVLHGIGPSCWDGRETWCPDPLGMGDVLVPTGTLLTFKNLPFVAIYREFTAEELYRLTHGPKVDPAWNMPVVDEAIRWAEEETRRLMGTTWSQYWDPQRFTERIKENSGLYASDLVQTLALLDFYFWDGEGKEQGWKRRMIFDAWGGYENYKKTGKVSDKNWIGKDNQWVYNSGDRIYARKLSEILHFQFADLSATAPFRYHTVRSLGFFLFDACHLQNGLRCSFAEAVFEQLLNYFRVKSLDEAERALKIQLMNRGLIDETVTFLRPEERWQPNAQIVEMGMAQYQQIINENSASYVQNQNFSRDKVEKTRFQVMAEVNAMTTLISAALAQAYRYQTTEYEEIFRRFCIPNSRDPDVREFRARCLKQGVPEKMLVAEAWELEPERVMGAGNKTLEMTIAQQLMEWRTAFAPEAQQEILHDAVLAITDDAAKAASLVPQGPRVSDAKHDAMLAFGSLMVGAQVAFTPAQNRIEIAETLLGELALKISQIKQTGNMASMSDLIGLQNVAKHIAEVIQQIAANKPDRERAKRYGQALGKLVNEIKGFAQRLAEQQKAQQGNGLDGKDKAKIMATMLTAKAKMANTRESHAERTAQRQAQFELEQRREDEKHSLEMRREIQKQQVEDTATDLKTAAEVRRGRLRSLNE